MFIKGSERHKIFKPKTTFNEFLIASSFKQLKEICVTTFGKGVSSFIGHSHIQNYRVFIYEMINSTRHWLMLIDQSLYCFKLSHANLHTI